MQYGRVLFGVILALVVVGVLAGVGFTTYNAGVAQGMIDSGKLVVQVAPGGVAPVQGGAVPGAPLYAPYGFHGPFGYSRFGFGGFGFLGCLVPLFFILLVFGLFRFVFRPRWGRGWGGPGMRGGGWDPAQGDIPPAVKEWHRKLHEQEGTHPPAAPAAAS